MVVSAAMLQPITDAVNSNLDALLPVGIGIMAIMVGVTLIPRIIWKFF